MRCAPYLSKFKIKKKKTETCPRLISKISRSTRKKKGKKKKKKKKNKELVK